MKIVLCDDHSLFIQSLAAVLTSRGHDVVGCFSSPTQAIEALASNEVDVCVMDLRFPSASGIDGVRGIVEVSPRTRVVVLTGSGDRRELCEAIAAGARGLTVKGEGIERVIETIERVNAGEIVVSDLGPAEPEEHAFRPVLDRANPLRFLTAREREVLEHLVAGESTLQLSQALGVRYSTGRTHVQKVLTKLGLHSKLEAVALAARYGLVEPSISRSSAERRWRHQPPSSAMT